ncbi:MAG: DNA-formamidopyrimidine glycosylase family protein [Actinomycetota bacterium]
MPELPEMQALSERLNDLLVEARIVRADALSFSGLKTVAPAPATLAGMTVKGVTRRAKYLIFDLDQIHMLVHLSQGGRLDVERPPKSTRPKGAVARVVLEPSDGGRVALLVKEFGTERKAAWWILHPGDPSPLDGLGPEPFSDEFAKLIATSVDRRRLHTVLRDQHTVAGIGRGFADDILHEAMLSPFDSLASLDGSEREALVGATHKVLTAALERERERTGGLPTKLQGRFTVHGKAGEVCPRCGTELKRVSYESHEIAYCPQCQTKGKVLADRRLSRLLK